MGKIRILVADPYPLFGKGLGCILNREKNVECVALAQDGEETVRLAQELHPDVIIMEVDMPKMDGIEVTKQIKSCCPATSVVIMTHCRSDYSIAACIQAGVDAFLSKDAQQVDLMNAICMVRAGEGVFNLQSVGNVLRTITPDKYGGEVSLSKLRDRQLDILKLVARGITNKEIASELGISTHTVASHLVSIFRKIGVASRTEAVSYAWQKGLLDRDGP